MLCKGGLQFFEQTIWSRWVAVRACFDKKVVEGIRKIVYVQRTGLEDTGRVECRLVVLKQRVVFVELASETRDARQAQLVVEEKVVRALTGRYTFERKLLKVSLDHGLLLHAFHSPSMTLCDLACPNSSGERLLGFQWQADTPHRRHH